MASAFAEYHTLIVLSRDDHKLYDLDAKTGQGVKQLQLTGAPREAIYSWDENYLFVSIPDSGEVVIVEAATLKQIGRVQSADFKKPAAGSLGTPFGLAATVDGLKLYVGVDGGLITYNSKQLVFNPEYKQTPKKLMVGAIDGQHFRIQTTTDKLFYPSRKDNKVVVIDTKKDEVKQVVQTGGKGLGRLAVAQDIRYVASTHADSGDTVFIHPLTKEIVSTVKTGPGSSAAQFVPDTKNPTHELYVTSAATSSIAVVDLDTWKISSTQKIGETLTDNILHYRFAAGWGPPREGTVRRVMENDLFTAYANAMFLYDVSPTHEHRGDMAAILTGSGIAKMGCWKPECPPEAIPNTPGGLPYVDMYNGVGGYTGISRGTLHIEEGGSPSPRRMITFDLRNNYYRMQNPPRKEGVFAQFKLPKIVDNRRVVAWELTLRPGDKPFTFPEGEYAVVYLGGGLLRMVFDDGEPQIVSRFFNEFDYDPRHHTVESLTNPVRMSIMEFK